MRLVVDHALSADLSIGNKESSAKKTSHGQKGSMGTFLPPVLSGD
jgi:hypothetical protein